MSKIIIVRNGITKMPEEAKKCPECTSTNISYEVSQIYGIEGWNMLCFDCQCEWIWEKSNETTK